MMMSRGVPERISFIMVAVLCVADFLMSALSDSNVDLPTRVDYLRSIVKDILTCVPPNGVELWFGWRRIYMGENVFSRMPTTNFSVRFPAPSSRLSTVVPICHTQDLACRFLWLNVNVPGDDGIGGKELRTSWPAQPVGMLIVLIFPQNVRLDENAASQTLKSLRDCDADGLQGALQLGRADTVNVYATALTSCGNAAFLASNQDTPKAISGRFSLGDPVAANFYVPYMYNGPAPGRHPSSSPPIILTLQNGLVCGAATGLFLNVFQAAIPTLDCF